MEVLVVMVWYCPDEDMAISLMVPEKDVVFCNQFVPLLLDVNSVVPVTALTYCPVEEQTTET